MHLGVCDDYFGQHSQLERPAHFRGMGVEISPTFKAPLVVCADPIAYTVDVAADLAVDRLAKRGQVLRRIEKTGLGAVVQGSEIVDGLLDANVLFERGNSDPIMQRLATSTLNIV